ncbi:MULTISPECIES: hypothetical protein [Bacillus cereus group]|uniref:Uncharacterized protein n=2 Tax=Bacillus cereus group TaxID=86661 RepID=A0A158RSW7_BACC3|nr:MULTISPECIES: hypothetical protein [Bacillus cereus group]ACO30538.1 hypothetical protein BCA_2430 [Bacillus cereus 03BB102]AJG54111.1 hypothetical protein AS54_2447 [Bacillus cereus 03BB102]AJH70380.1 hypothetical protein BF32_5421 [Bacillus thuringiensis]EEK56508.1 hypothetical protein bcere0004_21350 [Bacillus cereus BGSC 6E1]KXY54216.1 hypothetical protein AT275_02700 [Bacillus cereus]
MPTMLQEEVEKACKTYVSRIILISGSALFLVSDVILAISSFKAIDCLENTLSSTDNL